MSQSQTHTQVRPARNVSLAPTNQGRIECESGIARAAKRSDAGLPEVLNGFKSSSVGLIGCAKRVIGTLLNSLKTVNSHSKAGRASKAQTYERIELIRTSARMADSHSNAGRASKAQPCDRTDVARTSAKPALSNEYPAAHSVSLALLARQSVAALASQRFDNQLQYQGRIECESGIARAAKRSDAGLPEVLNGFKSSSVGLIGCAKRVIGTLLNSLKTVNSHSKAGRASIARPIGFIALCLTVFTAPLLAQDPVSYWSFNVGTGSQAQDSFSSHHGTIEDATWTTGILGSGLDFNSQGARVSVPGPSLDGTYALTLALWFKADSFAISDARLMSRAQGTAANDHDWMLSTISTGGQIRLRARLRTNGSTKTLIASSGALSTAAWYHAAFVYDGSQMHLYLDGQQVGSTARSGSLDERSGLGIALANQPQGAGAKSFDGALDEVRIYNRALNPSEIQALADPCDGQPVASFDVAGDGAVAPATLDFDASSSSDCDGTLTQYTWDFGDGGQGQGVNASHLYAAPGTYTVTLTVEDDSQNTASSEQTVTLSDGQPLAHWTLDDGSGTQALDSRGGFHGTLDGAAWVTGIQGGALEFDGSNDRVSASGPGLSGDQLTISAWLKADDFDISDARILSRAQGTSANDHDWMLSTVSSGGQVRLRARLRVGTSTTTLIASSGVVTPGDWIHAAVTYDGTNLRLFQDGLEVGSTALTGPINERSGLGVALGNQPSGAGDRPFDGTLDDIRIYARALNNAELADLADPCDGQPIASFTWDRLAHDTLSFDAAESSDCDGTLTSYDWDFGDGQSGTGVQTQHTYAQGGIFAIQLTVTDNQGNTHSNSHSVQIYEPGQRIQEGLLAEYHLGEGSGALVQDVSGVAPALDLTVADPNQITWEACGGLTVDAETLISSSGAATKLNSAIPANDEITIEAWLDPESLNQTGPARIVTLSDGAYNRNFTLGQDGGEYVVRLRTTQTGLNGSNPVTITNQGAVRLAPTHVVYTRNADGQAIIYVDGVQRGSEQIGGDLSNWSSSYSLALANEINDSRSWLGTLYLVAVYDRVLSLSEIAQNYQSSLPSTCNRAPVARASASTFAGEAPLQVSFSALGSYDLDGDIQQFNWDFGDGNTGSDSTVNHSFQSPGSHTVSLTVTDDAGATASRNLYVTVVSPGEPYRISQDLLTFYAFREGADTQVFDLAGGAAPLDLEIQDGDHVNWLACGGLRIIDDTIIGPVPVPDWNIVPSRGITLEAWVKPENTTQGPTSPARVITYSDTPTTRNFTLGQKADEWDVRFRTTQTGTNGSNPSTSGGQATTDVTHVVYTWDGSGMGRLYVNGSLAASQSIGGDISNWDLGYAFALANEINPMERSFLGDYHLVALYDRALNASEVQQNHAAGLLGFSIIEPQVSASADPGQVLVGQTVAFDAQANTGCYAQIAGWLWEFGDGTTASAPQVNHAYAQPGSYTATVTVTDTAGDTGQASVQVIVVIGNQPPTITSTPVTSVQATQPYSYDVEATDGDGDVLVFSLTQAPAGMTIDGATGLIAWTPSAADVGDHPVAILVDDQNGGTASQSFTLTVSAAPNQVPEITSTPITTAIAVEPYSYDVEATDGDGDALVYSLTQAPTGMTIDGATGLIAWTPSAADVGDHTVAILVDDQNGGTDSQSYTLTVSAAPNQNPEITSTPITAAQATLAYSYDVEATDGDGDVLVFSLTQAPTGMTIDGATGLITWTPAESDQGDHPVAILVDDQNGGTDSQSYTLTVSAAPNQNPEITSTPITAAVAVEAYSYDVEATDGDGDTLVFSLTQAPAGMTIDASSGLIEWTPDVAHQGDHTVSVLVDDQQGGTATQSFTLSVTLPTLAITISQPTAGALVTSPVTLSGVVSPAQAEVILDGQSLGSGSTNWNSILTLADGTHTLTAEAQLQTLQESTSVTFVVDNTAPSVQIDAPVDVMKGQNLDFTVTASDANAIVQLLVTLNGETLYDGPNASFNGSWPVPADYSGGPVLIQATATDEVGLQTLEQQSVDVLDLTLDLVITEPDDGSAHSQADVRFAGTVSPESATVTVQGQATQRTGQVWEATLTLADGQHLIPVEATAVGATPVTLNRTITVDTQGPVISYIAPAIFVRGFNYTVTVTAADDSAIQSLDVSLNAIPYPAAPGSTRSFQVQVPSDEPLTQYSFTAHAVDVLGHSADLPLDVTVRDLSELDRVQVVIQSPDHGATFLDPNQTIQGHLVPADAALFLYDQPVPVQPDGTFSHPASLSNGLNTFLFYGRKDGYLDGVGKVDLYLDNTAPEVRIVYPADGLRTNQQLIDIYGTVSDTYDRDPALTRDGNPVPVSSGRFREDQVTLQPGANTFTYIATDATGHSGQAQVTIHLDQSGPGLSLSHDPWVRPGASFNVNLSVTPAETVRRLQLFVDHQLVHDGTTGDAFQGQFQAGLFTTQIPIRAVCRDSYGNRVEENGTVQVTRAHYAFGRVLEDGTSHPVPGMQVTLTSPEGTSQATTDASGRYEAYVYGYPLTVAVNHAEYAVISRRSHEDRPIWRVPDLRLTARNQPIALSGNNLVDLDWMTVQLSGAWNGSARVTAVGPQAIAELLPLGFSPVAAFEVTGAAGSGTLNWNVPNLSRFPIGADLVFLSLQTDGWQVLATETVQAKQIATSFANQANGAFLAAIMDAWQSESVPAVGTFLRRSSDLMVPPNTLADSQTNPPSVSIVDEPQTVVSVSFQANDLLRSGAQARILAAEQHDRIDGLLTVPDSILDVFCYAYEFGRHDHATAIGGRLNLRALETVSPDITRYARIDLDTYPGFLEQGAFLEQPQWDLGNLHLDFSGSVLAPVVVDVQTLLPLDLPQINGVEWLTAFQLTVGGTLPTGAQLSYDYGSANHLVLLRQLEARTWVYAGQLTQSGESWLSSALVEPLDRSGTYALMAVQFPLTEVTGTVLNGATPVVDARISNNRLPWFGVSRAAGVYATVLPQADAQHQLLAYDPISRRSGTRSLSTTAGQTALSGIDIALAAPDFRVVESVPVQGETHLALIPQLSLSFSMPVSLDLAHLVSHISLEPAGGGSSMPLQVVPNENRTGLSIVPVQVLAASQDYQLHALTGLENLYGDTLSQPFTLTFSTRALAQAAALDLAAFHMRWDGSNMHLEAPAEAVAPGTRLRVLNHSTFFTLELDLLAGAFSEIVDAQIGDSLELQAQLTTGETLVHHISLVNTPSGGYVLGNEPSRIPLPDGNELWVDRVDHNALTEVRIESVDETQALAKLAQVQAWDNLPPGGFHTGLKFVVDQPGTMPAFEGRLVLPYDETTMNNKDIHLLAVGDPQMLPPDPNDPAVLEPITLGRILSSERVTDNEQVSKRDLNKFAKTGLQEIAAGLSVNGTVMEQSTENTVVGWLIDTSYQDPETGTSAVAVNFNIDCLSEAFPGIERPSQYATWHDDYPEIINPSDVTWQPTRDAVIYRVIQFGDGSVAHVCMGTADITGRATPTWLGSAGQFLVALDPVTNEIARVESWLEHTQGSSITIRDRHGIELATYVRTRVVFDPESFTINQGGDVPPRVSLRWEVWDQEDGELVRNGEQTSQVKSLNLLDVSAQRTLKAFVNSSQEMPVPDLRVNGQSIDQVEMEDPFNAVFTLPLGLCAQPVTLRSNLEVQNGAGQTTTVNHNLLVVDRNQDCACPGGEADERCAGNPVVITTLPSPDKNAVPIDQRFYFRFNEPVLGLQNIRLQSGGDQHKLQFFDSFGVTVTNQPVCEVYATADRPLNFLTAYTLTVTGITDEAGNAISQPYTVNFTTVGLETQDPDHDLNGNLRQSRTALWAHRNLMLYLAGEKDGFQNFDLHLFDIRVPHEARQAIWSARLASPRGENSLFCLQVFLPHELGLDAESADYSEVVRQENSRIALGDIPHNSIIAVTYWNHYLGVGAHNYLDLYRYDGNLEPEDRIVHMPLGEIAAPTSSDKLGSHLVQTFYGWYGDPGPTVVYDIHAILHPETGFEALRQRHQSNQITVLEYENALARLGIVSHYPIPRDLTQATSFYRKQGALFEPVFALAGARKPAIYPLDPSSQPPIMGITSGGDPDQDDRMLYRTNYFNNPGHQYSSNVNAGVAQGVRFVAATGQLIERDVMVTCHRLHGTNESYLEAFVLDPQTGGALSAAKRIRFPAPGLRTIAVDRHKHMVAVQSRDFTFSVLDLRTWLESDSEDEGFLHPAFFVRGEQMNHNFNTLVMHQGTVIGITEGGVAGELGLKRILIAPTSYRQLGWEYIDLNAWMDGDAEATPVGQISLDPYMVFYATDLRTAPGQPPEFVAELGTFDLETTDPNQHVKCEFKSRDTSWSHRIERFVAEPSLQHFSTHALTAFFNVANKKLIRQQGYLAFDVSIEIEMNGVLVDSVSYPFLVAYQYPNTQFEDPYRQLQTIDGLSAYPSTGSVDYEFTNSDPRLDLSPRRLLHSDFAFQVGSFGVGMVSGQALHVAQPTWWDLGQLSSNGLNSGASRTRLDLYHPGQFHVESRVDGGTAEVLNDLKSRFSKVNGKWELRHRDAMTYVFATREDLLNYTSWFDNLNQPLATVQDAVERVQYPVVRYAGGHGTSLYGPARLEQQVRNGWLNRFTFRDHLNRPSSTPSNVTEFTGDKGVKRTLSVTYGTGSQDHVIQDIDTGALKLDYEYDEDGYLIRVRFNEMRDLVYTWEPIGIELGPLVLKRLKRIEQGAGAESQFVEFVYSGSSLRVQSVMTRQGARPVSVAEDGTTGLPAHVTLGGLGSARSQHVTFDESQGSWLSRGYGPGSGSPPFEINWTTVANGSASERLITHNSYLNQTYTYEPTYGRLTSYSINGLLHQWSEFGSGIFWADPTSYTDPIGNLFSMEYDFDKSTTTANDGETIVYTPAGVPSGSKRLDGFEVGPKESKFYLPFGEGYDVKANTHEISVPLPGTQKPSMKLKFDEFGDLRDVNRQGVKSTLEYNELGQPKTSSYLRDLNAQTNYLYESDQAIVSTTDEGHSVTERYNLMGWLDQQTVALNSGEAITSDYTYDDLGRLERVTQGSETVLELQYLRDTDLTTQVKRLNGRIQVDYVYSADPPRILSMSITQDGKTRDLVYETDVLGRVIREQVAGLGIVRYQYDTWGRLKKVLTDNLEDIRSYDYGDKNLIVSDHIQQTQTAISYADASGLNRTVTVQYASQQVFAVDIQTSIQPANDGRGDIFTEEIHHPDVVVTHKTDAQGHVLGGSYGLIAIDAPVRNDYGSPEQFTGALNTEYTYDEVGRLNGGTTPAGQTYSMNQDVLGRVTTGKVPRGTEYTVDYHNQTGIPKDITFGDVPVLTMDNLVQGQTEGPLGNTRAHEVETLGQAVKTTKPGNATHEATSYEASQTMDPYSGLTTQITDYAGLSFRFPRDSYGRIASGAETPIEIGGLLFSATWESSLADGISVVLKAAGPNSQDAIPVRVSFDYRGQVASVTKGEQSFAVLRDSLNRPLTVTSDNQSQTYTYQGELLVGMTSSRGDTTFSEHNALGQPGRVITPDAEIEMGYYGDGTVAFQKIEPLDGSEKLEYEYSPQGELLVIWEGQDHIALTYNNYGDVKTVTKNQELPVEVYGDRNQLTQTLDPGTTIVRTVEDSKASQQFPFLPSPFEFKYDGNERLTQVLFNGLPLYQFTYDGLLLESITVPGQGQGSSKRMKAPETISHDYDGEYRLSGLHSSTRGDLGQVSFSDDGRDRVERYTDPNGVTAQYAYTPEGWVQSIEIGDGPSFHYDYDAQGNLTSVEVDGLAASFNDYQDRVPETMDWLSDGDVLRTFSLTRTPEGKLDRIESNDGAYLLDLDWQQEAPSDYPMVVRVERAGPGFGEVIVPRYVTVTTYDQDKRLDGITLTRSTGQVIEESYGISAKRLAGSLYRSVDGVPVLAWDKTMDVDAEAMRTSAVQDALTGESVAYVYDDFGNLETTSYSGGADWQYTFNAFRSLEEVQGPGSLITNGFDYRGRRVSSSAALSGRALYFYQGNQVIAIGVQGISGAITWTHAIGRGPMGPSFIKDLRGGQDQFIFTDHLGTPFAYESAAAGTVTYTPFNPWGELLAYDGSRPPPYSNGNVQAQGFDLPVDAEFGLPPLGLSGHLRDASSGLIWMGVRAYEPRLGTFLTPDFRAPSFYDPTTYQEPYAFAAGNPLMFWDPNGLAAYIMNARQTTSPNYIGDHDEFINEWLDFSYEVARDAKGDVLTQQGVVLGYDPMLNPTNTPLPKLLGDDVLVFIHGYNVTELSAIEKWTRKIYDRLTLSGFKGDVISLSWRGDEPFSSETDNRGESGTTFDPLYFGRNVDNARQTGTNLADLLLDIRRARRSAQINVVAHSLGNQVLLQGLEVARTNSRYRYLNLHNVVHLEAAADETVYYQNKGFFDPTPTGEFSKVPSTVNRVINMYSEADDVLRYAYQADLLIRRGGIILQSSPFFGYPRALGLRGTPLPFKNSLPSNYVEIDAQPFGISSHSAMVDNPYIFIPNGPPEVRPFWEKLVRNLYLP